MVSPMATDGRGGVAAVGQPAPVTNDLPVRGWPSGTNLEDSQLLTQTAGPDDTGRPSQIAGTRPTRAGNGTQTQCLQIWVF
jgi:hypothetical protein